MTLFRVQHNKNYTIINNTICKDNRLSWKAKGIWLYAFSRPDDWKFYISDIIKQSTDGKDSVYAGLKELENAGYLRRSRHRKQDGTFEKEIEMIFYETPLINDSEPKTDFPDLDNPDVDNPPLPNTDPVSIPEKQQQQPKTESVVVSLSLKNVDIPLDEKIWISKNYPEETILHAVEFATHPLTVLTKGLIQTIKWACKTMPKIPVDEAAESLKRKDEEREYFLENQRYAEQLAKEYYHKTKDVYGIRLAFDNVELDLRGNCHSVRIYFGDKQFKKLIEHELRKGK